MAPAATYETSPPDIGHLAKVTKPTRPTGKLPQFLLDEANATQRQPFNVDSHVCFEAPEKIFTMADVGYPGVGISDTAVSAPFPLFTQDAVKQMRAEIFSDSVLNDCQFSSSFVKNTIRGMGASRAPFIYDAWHSQAVLHKISQVAGTELIPAMDIEIAAINISINDSVPEGGEQPVDDGMSAFAWHYDSYPFVSVTILSDCTGMIGGETALKTGAGDIMKVRGPAMGTAVVMQGRYINHQALKAFGGRERISMVTSFRPKSPFVKDESVLTGVRPISNVSELYTQWTRYRLEVLEERIRDMLKRERLRESYNRDFDLRSVQDWMRENIAYMTASLNELK